MGATFCDIVSLKCPLKVLLHGGRNLSGVISTKAVFLTVLVDLTLVSRISLSVVIVVLEGRSPAGF